MTNIVPSYLTTNDLCKLLSGPKRVTPMGRLPLSNNNAVLVYAVSSNSPAGTIFLSSANFTNTSAGGEVNPNDALFRTNGYVILLKNGSGRIVRPQDAKPDYHGPVAHTSFATNADRAESTSTEFAPLCR